jgi:hypothetical protein
MKLASVTEILTVKNVCSIYPSKTIALESIKATHLKG